MFIIKVFFLTGWIYSHNASWALQFSSPVVMIFTTLNLFYFRMLPHKFQLPGWLFLEEKMFLRFTIYIPMKKFDHQPLWPKPTPGVMVWTILNVHYMRMLRRKLQLFWSSGFEFWKIPTNVQSVLVIPSCLPLEQDKLPLPINGLCQVWLKLAPWFLRRCWK